MFLLLKSGHKINKPVPLFTKIEQTFIDELKKKYSGVQQTKDATLKPEKSKLFNNVEEAEKAVADQGEKVRILKSSGVEKAVWQPEVTILLELKKQLANLQAQKGGGKVSKDILKEETPPVLSSTNVIKKLETEIAHQVRSGFIKSEKNSHKFMVFRVKKYDSSKQAVVKKALGNPKLKYS